MMPDVNYIDWHLHPFRAERWYEIWEPGAVYTEPRRVLELVELPDNLDALNFLAGRQPVFTGGGAELTRERSRSSPISTSGCGTERPSPQRTRLAERGDAARCRPRALARGKHRHVLERGGRYRCRPRDRTPGRTGPRRCERAARPRSTWPRGPRPRSPWSRRTAARRPAVRGRGRPAWRPRARPVPSWHR